MDHDCVDKKTSTIIGTSNILALLVFITTAAAFIIFKWKRRHLEIAARRIPGPPALPLIGNAVEFRGNLQSMYQNSIMKQYSFNL